jgi:hypothetical protein
MRRRWSARDVAGVLSLAAFLALASPGVRVARAESPGAAAPSGGAMCRADDPPSMSGARLATETLRLLQEQARAAGDEEIVVLNGRGYNYGGQRDLAAELALIEAEARRQGGR